MLTVECKFWTPHRACVRTARARRISVNDLFDVAAEWKILSKEERVEESLHWAHLMADFLPELYGYRCDELLSEEQHERYEELRGRLKEALPLIETLNLYRPPVPLDE